MAKKTTCIECTTHKKYIQELELDKRIQARMITAFFDMLNTMKQENKLSSADLSRYMNDIINNTIQENATI